MWAELYRLVPGLADVVTSTHCHDDLGVAVANSLAGVEAGCRQVECAINGIGERAGNASLEEIVMLFAVREAAHGFWTEVQTTEIAKTSRLITRMTGYQVQPNKAIVGRNAFAHESGIHQDGVLKERTTFEIMDAATIGLDSNSLVLGKHSGRHALRNALEQLGFEIDGAALNTAFKRFKEVADRKKTVTALDLEALVSDEMRETSRRIRAGVASRSTPGRVARRSPRSVVSLPGDGTGEGSFTGDGPVEAFFSALNVACGREGRLKEYHVHAVTEGRDALAEVTVVLELEGVEATGQGVSPDTMEASGRAYLRALTNAIALIKAGAEDRPPRAGRDHRAGSRRVRR